MGRSLHSAQQSLLGVHAGVIQQTRLVLALKQKDNLEAGKQLRKRRQVTALEVMLEARDDQGNPVGALCKSKPILAWLSIAADSLVQYQCMLTFTSLHLFC